MTSKIKVNILADGGDNSIITSDGAGSFTASSGLASSVQSVGGINNTPTLFAYLNTTQTATNNNYTKVQLNSTSIDTANGMNTSTYEYTVQEAGKYYVMAHIIFTTGAASALRDHNI